MEYKGYTIQEDREHSWGIITEYMFFLKLEGIQHDADHDGDGFRYCGNCRWADSIEEAKEQIDELIDIENAKK